ncbi:MAG: (Fe-S)-binding protein [Candidatus Helarchaeota archaeon]
MVESKELLKIVRYKTEIFKCTRCGYCREMVRERDNTFRICPIRENTAGFEAYTSKGKMMLMRGVLEGEIGITPKLAEIFFTCSTCGNCRVHCPVDLPTTDIFEEFRCDLAEREFILPPHIAMGQHTREHKNPYGESQKQRVSWLDDAAKVGNPAPVAYFVGCTSSFRQIEIAKATYQILKKSGIDFTLLGSNEWCCGSPLFRTGQIDLAKEVAMHNIEKLKDLGVKTIYFSCAGCYRTFQTDYPKHFGKLGFKIESISKLVLSLIREGRLPLKNKSPVKITYHDPCHTGRMTKRPDFKTPRKVIDALLGVDLIEMRSREKGSMCCGAGGGLKAGYPELSLKIATNRLQQANSLKVDYLVSTCPFCKRNLSDAQKATDSPIKVIDLTELVMTRCENENL